jgi:hypothetical protein
MSANPPIPPNPPVQVPAAASLDQINTAVRHEEGLQGPLTAMGNDGTFTLLTFDDSQEPPAANTVVVPDDAAGNPPVPPGTTPQVKGTIFVAGQLKASTGYRP